MKRDMLALVDAVRRHALNNYNKDGWDYVIECWETSDIEKAIDNAANETVAIARVRAIVKTMDDRRKDIEGEIF